MNILKIKRNSLQIHALYNEKLYGAFCRIISCTAMLNDAAKIMECSVRLQGRCPSGLQKNLHTSLRSGSIFLQNLAYGNTPLYNAFHSTPSARTAYYLFHF